MVNGAIRFNKNIWIGIALDEENGDNEVTLELDYPDGEKRVITGVITWED